MSHYTGTVKTYFSIEVELEADFTESGADALKAAIEEELKNQMKSDASYEITDEYFSAGTFFMEGYYSTWLSGDYYPATRWEPASDDSDTGFSELSDHGIIEKIKSVLPKDVGDISINIVDDIDNQEVDIDTPDYPEPPDYSWD